MTCTHCDEPGYPRSWSFGVPLCDAHAETPAEEEKPTTTSYKVWIQVEKVDLEEEGTAQYDNVGLPDCLGEFDTFEEATAHIRSLPGWDFYPAETSDYREGVGK